MTNLLKVSVLEADISPYHNLANTDPKYVEYIIQNPWL
jgi:hypothetical protein